MHHLQHIAELAPLLESVGVRHAVLPPGSRNAPLIQLFSSGNAFNCHSIVDERSAGYAALGMARQLGEPVVVATTSGTAVLNLGPAVAEAFYQHLPLVVLTADRPREVIRQFNNQVIDQVAPFYSHTLGFYEFPLALRNDQELKSAMEAAGQLIGEAAGPEGGPVHINLPLLEPLYVELPAPRLSFRITVEAPGSGTVSSTAGPVVRDRPSDRILVLAGMGCPGEGFRGGLLELADTSQTAVIAENISNLRTDRFVNNPELVLAGASGLEKESLAPDLVITYGGQVVSKRLKQFLESMAPVETVEAWDALLEGPDHDSAPSDGSSLFQNAYLAAWKRIEERERNRFSDYLDGTGFNNLSVVRSVIASVPEGSVVHLGNSGTIRYSQLLAPREDLSYYSNRGTSGIDGCLSAAVGAALVSDNLHLLIVGDLSFVYDSNALWNKEFPRNLRIIVLNDGGGGIFRLLEGPDRMDFFEQYSVTHHPVSIELLAQSFGRIFQRAGNSMELERGLEVLFDKDSACSILEVDTTGSENSRIFRDFFNRKH